MFCQYCGFKNSSLDNFCAGCGILVIEMCRVCSALNIHSKAFTNCYSCGGILNVKKKKKSPSQILINQKYDQPLKQIREYLIKASRWVSYQDIALNIGLKSCYERININDEKSTVGYLIYLDKIREEGYTVKAFHVLYEIDNTQKGYIMRFIKNKSIKCEDISHKEILCTIKSAYQAVDFSNMRLISIEVKR